MFNILVLILLAVFIFIVNNILTNYKVAILYSLLEIQIRQQITLVTTYNIYKSTLFLFFILLVM